MNISNIKIQLINEPNSKAKALASFVIDNAIVVHNVKIIGYTAEYIKAMPDFMHDTFLSNPVVDNCHVFITMPSQKTPNGEYKDIVHPLNTETREQITSAILAEYQKAKQEA